MNELWIAFTLGLFGGFHCLGMCGPIAMVLPFQATHKWKTLINVLLYNFGRVVTYTMLGLIPGLIGSSLRLAGLQQWLAIITGVALIFTVVFSINVDRELSRISIFGKASALAKKIMSKNIKRHHQSTLFITGLANGLLPCGMVYIAFAGAFLQQGILDSMLYLFAFGLGTLPLMIIASLSTQLISGNVRHLLRKLYPGFIMIIGLLLIIRGLEIELPPDVQMWLERGATSFCH